MYKKWTEKEEKLLIRYYPLKTRAELESIFSERTWSQIKDKANKLKLIRINKEPKIKNEWSKKELIILKSNWHKPKEEIQKLIPNRTWKAIREKANKEGLSNRSIREDKWSEEEDNFIKKNYPDKDKEYLEKKLNRSWIAICSRAYTLGIKRNYVNFWTEAEIDFLINNYSKMTKKDILKNLPNHSWKAISIKSSALGLSREKESRNKELKKTNLKKYGVENVFQLENIKEKSKQTNLEKYGVENYTQTNEYRQVVKEKLPHTLKKIFKTKKKNGTFNTSKPEEELKHFILTLYPNTIHQYISNKYPFSCDFFIPELDLYIEFQGVWTHGQEPYNGVNLNPEWIEKSKQSKFYKNAIEVYTKSDPEKRRIAQENNLNYLEIWYSDYQKGFDWIYSLILKQGLPLSYKEDIIKKEFQNIKSKKGDYTSLANQNRIIEHFQQHFYSRERDLWNNPFTREKLILNREKYKFKTIDELTIKQVLQGFKISGIHIGFSFFSSLWIKAFIEEFNIESIYDPCAGWGQRMLGACDVEYYGNDISVKTYEGLCKIKKYFNLKKAYIYNNPAEDFILNKNVDAVFTCPPYFDIEIYESEATSTSKYSDYKSWLNVWWRKVVQNSLKSNPKYFAFVINTKYKEDLVNVCLQEKLELLKEIPIGKNSKNHFQRVSEKSHKGEFLVILKND